MSLWSVDGSIITSQKGLSNRFHGRLRIGINNITMHEFTAGNTVSKVVVDSGNNVSVQPNTMKPVRLTENTGLVSLEE